MLEIQALTYNDLAPVMPVAGAISAGGTMGRNADNAVVLPDPVNTVSRYHLQFDLESGGRYRVRNISKKNPAFIDGQELEPGMACLLQDCAQIIVGAYVLQARYVAPSREGAPAMPPPAAAPALGVSDDLLATLLDSGPVPQAEQAAPPDDENLAGLFAENPRIVRGDPMPMLNERGIDPGSLDGKGDELINGGGGDAEAMTRELLRDPLSARADRRLQRDSGFDPLEALFGDGGGEFDDILQGDKNANAALNVAHMDLTHGPELGGLFHLPEAERASRHGDPGSGGGMVAPVASPPDENGANGEIDRLIAGLPVSGDTASPVGGEDTPFPSSADDDIGRLLRGPESVEAWQALSSPAVDDPAAGDAKAPSGLPPEGASVPDAQNEGRMDEINRLIAELDAPLSGGVLPETGGTPSGMLPGSNVPRAGGDLGIDPNPPAWPEFDTTLEPDHDEDIDRPSFRPDSAPPPARLVAALAGEATQTPLPQASATADARALYDAFIEGLGVELLDRAALDKDFMKILGQLLRGYTQGTVDMIAGRTTVKQAVRANVTVIKPEGNNPLKFSPDGKAALLYLLGKPFPGFMGPVEAVWDAFTDLRAHQVGIVSGTKSALNHVLDRFDPALIDDGEAERGLFDSVLPQRRKARLWEAYERHFRRVRESAADHFQDFFGDAFLEAYEKAIAAIQPGERRHGP
ncbi:MAG: type VI secretion system-associated FHA domain protein TagH [Azoarcus sp.]|jgi:predicted component of type VI protein secretion system|nr:type VI secretion system-associated FHA domain protein TagH [Azoarcus sp.]